MSQDRYTTRVCAAMAACDTLEKTMNSVMRRCAPERLLHGLNDCEKTLLENIMHLAQETIPQIDLTSTEMTKGPDVFCLRLHLSGREAVVSLQQLRLIQAYSPARVLDVQVAVLPEKVQVLVRVAAETANIMYSEVDVIRITKRARAI